MSKSTQPRTFVRAINALSALALAVVLLSGFWPVVKVFGLARADLQYQGDWIAGHSRQITAVTPGGVADRAGLKPGDVLEFDPSRNDDWVLASYRHMPEGFSAMLPVRHVDGSQSVVNLAPERVAYLANLNDRLALVARLAAWSLMVALGVVMVWAHPSVMTWSLLLATAAVSPFRVWVAFYLAFQAGIGFSPVALFLSSTWGWVIAVVPFGLCFPRDSLSDWPRWKRWLGLMFALAVILYLATSFCPAPFERDSGDRVGALIFIAVVAVSDLWAIAALVRTYRRSNREDQARLKWALVGISSAILGVLGSAMLPFVMFGIAGSNVVNTLSGSDLTPMQWAITLSAGLMTVSLGYAVLRQRVVDVQFAISRTVVYGVVSTIVLVFLAVLHWLLGRMIEHSGFAFGIEGVAAVGLGLVLHRASRGINTTVDRVLFRKHHAAEERLRQVTAALPFASTEQSIAQAIVVEPTRNLDLASAALFYREGSEGPLRRVLAVGWGESHAATLDAESLLVRYLQAEHAALRLDEEHEWLPAGMPEGAAHPVLAIPIVSQHVLTAVVLYGAHANSTLPDPDEVVLLEALAKAAAASHQQVRIAMLMREKAAAEREAEARQVRIEEQERTIARLMTLAPVPLSGVHGSGR